MLTAIIYPGNEDSDFSNHMGDDNPKHKNMFSVCLEQKSAMFDHADAENAQTENQQKIRYQNRIGCLVRVPGRQVTIWTAAYLKANK